MKVLLSVASTGLAYGGPAVSVTALAVALSQTGITVGLWSPDQASSDDRELLAAGVARLDCDWRSAMQRLGKPDIIHDNGIWLPHNHQLAAFASSRGVPRIVSPRGMLLPWALAHKPIKKQLAWWAYQRRDLRVATALHATSSDEAKHLKSLTDAPVFTVSNGIFVPPTIPRVPVREHTREALFLGRLYPVKGLPNLLDAWAIVRPEGWRLTLVGPDEAGHRAELEQLVTQLGLGDRVTFEAPILGEEKYRRLRKADLFILPSFSESFGVAIAEALSVGLPVLTTTGTPWSAIRENSMGWWVEPSVSGISEALRHATSLSPAQLSEMGQRARSFVRTTLSWEAISPLYIRMYEAILYSTRDTLNRAPSD